MTFYQHILESRIRVIKQQTLRAIKAIQREGVAKPTERKFAPTDGDFRQTKVHLNCWEEDPVVLIECVWFYITYDLSLKSR